MNVVSVMLPRSAKLEELVHVLRCIFCELYSLSCHVYMSQQARLMPQLMHCPMTIWLLLPHCFLRPWSSSFISTGSSRDDSLAILGCSGLDRLVYMPESTLKAYTSGKRRYLDFCQRYSLQQLQMSEALLLHFVAHLASLKLSF